MRYTLKILHVPNTTLQFLYATLLNVPPVVFEVILSI